MEVWKVCSFNEFICDPTAFDNYGPPGGSGDRACPKKTTCLMPQPAQPNLLPKSACKPPMGQASPYYLIEAACHPNVVSIFSLKLQKHICLAQITKLASYDRIWFLHYRSLFTQVPDNLLLIRTAMQFEANFIIRCPSKLFACHPDAFNQTLFSIRSELQRRP